MVLRPFFYRPTSCLSYLFGCTTFSELAVVDPHEALVEEIIAEAAAIGAPIVAVFETHVQGDHVSGLPELVARTGAHPYLPLGVDVAFAHDELDDGESVELGNTVVTALATPGHAPEHHAYLVADRRRDSEPWLVFSGDSLLVNDVGRPDLHSDGADAALALLLHDSLTRLLALPDYVSVYPSHYGGSVCGRGLSGNPFSTIGYERRHNKALIEDPQAFVSALLADLPPRPDSSIVARNRRGLAEPAANVEAKLPQTA